MSKTFTDHIPKRRALTRVLAAAGAAAAVAVGGLVAAPAAVAADCSAGYVALTFDDGPNGGTTNQLISTLNQYGATGTVFPTGENAQQNPGLMQAYASAGLQIGNHSWDHPYLTQMGYSQIQQQLSSTQDAIQQSSGVTPEIFRPPYGDTNGTVQQIASSLGMVQVLWDVDSQDYNNVSASQIRQAATQLSNGGVMLMHDWPQNTIQALPGIIQDLENRNLCTGHVSTSTGRAVAPPGGTPPPTTPPPTTPPPTTPPPTTPPPTTPPPANGGCSAEFTLVNSWNSGFQGQVTITAGSGGLSGWTTSFTLPSGTSIGSLWNADHSTSGSTVTASDVGWNGNLGAGQSTSFGFTGNGSAPSGMPVNCTS